MNIDEQIEYAKALLASLEAQKAEGCKAVEPEHPKAWKPEEGKSYCVITLGGSISSTVWNNDGTDKKLYSLGNCYPTQEAAEFEIERRKVETELRRYIYEHGGGDGEFVTGSDNYYICYDNKNTQFEIRGPRYMQTADIYSNSQDALCDAIQAIGEERIKKYYLRMKE